MKKVLMILVQRHWIIYSHRTGITYEETNRMKTH